MEQSLEAMRAGLTLGEPGKQEWGRVGIHRSGGGRSSPCLTLPHL